MPYKYGMDHSALGASTGQASAQVPQSMHLSSTISYLPSPSTIASVGQFSAQAPQEMQSSLILYAMIYSSVLFNFTDHSAPLYYITKAIFCKRDFKNFCKKIRPKCEQIENCSQGKDSFVRIRLCILGGCCMSRVVSASAACLHGHIVAVEFFRGRIGLILQADLDLT